MRAGAVDVVLADSKGIVYRGRKEGMNSEKVALAERTNPRNITGGIAEAMLGRELRMIELKREVDALCAQFGQPPRYEPESAEPARPAE